MWLVATVWYHANIKHFYHYRKFFWTVLVWTLDRALANYYFCLSLGCYDRDHALDGLNELFFPQSWRLGSPGSRCKQIQYLVRSLFLVYRQPPSHCILTWWREKAEEQDWGPWEFGPLHVTHLWLQHLFSPVVTDRGSWPSSINRNWLEARQESQVRLYWGLCCSRGKWEQTTDSLACLLPVRGASLFLIQNKSSSIRGVFKGQGLRWFAYPLGGVVCKGVIFLPTPCYCSRLFKSVAIRFFRLFVSFGPQFILMCTQLFLVPYSFFVFCGLRRCVSKYEHCSTAAKGPKSQPVSLTCIIHSIWWVGYCYAHSALRLDRPDDTQFIMGSSNSMVIWWPIIKRSVSLRSNKFFKPGFSSMWTENFQMYKLDLKKTEEPKIKLPTYAGS